jgi:hypothetical protein
MFVVQADERQLMTVEVWNRTTNHPLGGVSRGTCIGNVGIVLQGMMMTGFLFSRRVQILLNMKLSRHLGKSVPLYRYVNIVKASHYAAEKMQATEEVPVSAGQGGE